MEIQIHESHDAEDVRQLSSLWNEVETRCHAAGIKVDKRVGQEDMRDALILHFQEGRNTRTVNLWGLKDTRLLLAFPFENYRFVSGYEAICSYSDGTIEALIRPNRVTGISLPSLMFRSLGIHDPGRRNYREDESQLKLEIEDTSLTKPSHLLIHEEGGQYSISIGPPTKELESLLMERYAKRFAISLKITGLNISTHDRTLEILEKLSNSLLFQIDLKLELPLTLSRSRRPSVANLRKTKQTIDIQFPQFEYDQAAMSLYQYGRSATGLPLLQFLAFYQTIEFYFPTYSMFEAQRKVRNIIKNPAFNPQSDTDIAQLLSAVASNSGRGFGDERTQLKATLQYCVNAEELRDFFDENEERKSFFTNKKDPLKSHKVPLNSAHDIDLRGDVADRIYDIRCKIVHTKNTDADNDFQLLLPFSPEAASLHFDIELIQFLSRQILIAASRSMRL
ncbi:MAG TPA: hypothetical protein VGB77_01665 [Abditibacteriaceae bacterium]|jgi:hypothetical protein